MSDIPKIAMVASVGVGDGAIYLIIAENLVRNGFKVSFYSNPISQLHAWLPQMTVKPYPALEKCDAEFADYDLVLADSISILGKPHFQAEQFAELSGKYVYLGVGKVEKELQADHSDRLRAKLPPGKFNKLANLCACAGEIRFQNNCRDTTMVKNAVAFCSNILKLKDCIPSSGFTPPVELELQKHRFDRRVLLHPFSSTPDKNWPLKKFFALAVKLKAKGWNPVFTMSPAEREKLFLPFSDGSFDAPVFADLSDFAAFIYESKALIGNDSGSVNLASSLGIPTVTISRKGGLHRWRPAWTDSEVVSPFMRIKLPGTARRIWKPFVSVSRVYGAFARLAARIDA